MITWVSTADQLEITGVCRTRNTVCRIRQKMHTNGAQGLYRQGANHKNRNGRPAGQLRLFGRQWAAGRWARRRRMNEIRRSPRTGQCPGGQVGQELPVKFPADEILSQVMGINTSDHRFKYIRTRVQLLNSIIRSKGPLSRRNSDSFSRKGPLI